MICDRLAGNHRLSMLGKIASRDHGEISPPLKADRTFTVEDLIQTEKIKGRCLPRMIDECAKLLSLPIQQTLGRPLLALLEKIEECSYRWDWHFLECVRICKFPSPTVKRATCQFKIAINALHNLL